MFLINQSNKTIDRIEWSRIDARDVFLAIWTWTWTQCKIGMGNYFALWLDFASTIKKWKLDGPHNNVYCTSSGDSTLYLVYHKENNNKKTTEMYILP